MKKARASMNGHLDIAVIDSAEATPLLSKLRRMGIYSQYAENVINACQKLNQGQHIRFAVPKVVGREAPQTGRAMMSQLNSRLKDAKIAQRLRFIEDQAVIVSEPYKW